VNASGFAKISNAETEGSITYDVYTHSGANTDANAALWVQQDVGVVTRTSNVYFLNILNTGIADIG
jgi:hypothetical protein